MVYISYETIQKVFGTHIADNLGAIILGIILIYGLITMARQDRRKKRQNEDWLAAAQERQQTQYEYADELRKHAVNYQGQTPTPPRGKKYKAMRGKWSPTGWYFDPETNKWIPTDYIVEESKKRLKWNEEKRIWEDKFKK